MTWNVLDKDGNLVGVYTAETAEDAVRRCNEGFVNNGMEATAVSAEERPERFGNVRP